MMLTSFLTTCWWWRAQGWCPLVVLVVGWYSTNAVAAYYTKQALSLHQPLKEEEEESPLALALFLPNAFLVLLLSFTQLFVSGLLGATYLTFRTTCATWDKYNNNRSQPKRPHSTTTKTTNNNAFLLYWTLYSTDTALFRCLTMIGLCNAVGCVATNVGYLYGSISLVQLIKAMEPVATFVGDVLLLHTTTHNATTGAGVALVLMGATFASWQDPSWNNGMAVTAACISNAMLPIRNLYTSTIIKGEKNCHGHGQGTSQTTAFLPSGFPLFALVSSIGAVVVGLALLMTSLFMAPRQLWEVLPQTSMVISATAYAGYNGFSFLVLHQVDPVCHAILNVVKRAFVVITSKVALLDRTNTSALAARPSPRFWMGLAVTMVGLLVYVIGKKNVKVWKRLRQAAVQTNSATNIMCGRLGLFGLFVWTMIQTSATHSDATMGRQLDVQKRNTLRSDSPPRVLANVRQIPQLEPYNACNDRIRHFSCLKMIILEDDSLPVPLVASPELYPALCEQILSAQADTNASILENGHWGLCLQRTFNGQVSALVYLDDSSGKMSRQSLTADAHEIATALVHGSKTKTFRVVDRKTIVMRQWYTPYSVESNKQRESDSNRGNFVWQYGATRMINPFTTLFVAHNSMAASSATAFVSAMANALDLDSEKASRSTFGVLNGVVRKLDVPSIQLGIGIQKEFANDVAGNMDDLRLYDFQKEYLQLLQERQSNPAIGVRGNLTRAACENSGISHCVTMGCPSLTINREKSLGQALETNWNKLFAKLSSKGNSSVKIVLVMPRPLPSGRHKPVVQLFAKVAANYDTTVIIQVEKDRERIEEMGVDVKTKIFNNVEEWFDFTASVDLILSARIHGGMAGIARSTPTVVIPTDLRIQELADTMKIPQLAFEQLKRVDPTNLLSLQPLLTADFAAFEENRRRLLNQWEKILNGADLEVHPDLLQVLKQDDILSKSF